MNTHEHKHPRIFSALLGSAAAAFLLATFVLLLPIQKKVTEVELDARIETAQHAASAMQLAISTLVGREWSSLEGFSTVADPSSYETARRFSDAVIVASEGVVWAGVADLSGRIVAGSAGKHEGQDVSRLKWFQQGLRGNRAGVPSSSDNAFAASLSDDIFFMSRPVRARDGRVAGVAVYSLRLSWLTNFVAESADRLDVDAALLDKTGRLVFSHGNQVAAPISSEVKVQAELGTSFAGFSAIDGDAHHVSSVVPSIVSGNVPDFGLALVVRMPVSAQVSNLGSAASTMTWIVVGLFAVIGTCAVGFAVHFLKPISDLADAAKAIADGEPVCPTEFHSSREAMLLSSALIRLQTKADGPATNRSSPRGPQRDASGKPALLNG